jgi:hypothetical protein
MTVKKWLALLLIELALIGIVIFLFMNLDKQIAGLVAGFLFGLLGLFIGFVLLTSRTIKSFTFWWLFVYLFYSVIPMIFNRLNSWGADFSEVKIWGMEGPEFHKVSERIYMVLLLCTAIDLSLEWWKTRKRPQVSK